MNNYVFLDENNYVLNIASMPKEPVDEQIIQLLLDQNNASYCVKIKNYIDDDISQVNALDPRGTIAVGSQLIGNTFISPKPSPDHILDPTNQFWVLPFSMQEETIDEDPVLDHESNYWE